MSDPNGLMIAAGQDLGVAAGFDYSGLPASLVADLATAAERIRQRVRRVSQDIIDTGRDLMAVKDALPHGQFLPWIKAEFGWTDRTARNYMGAAELAGISETVSVLPLPDSTSRRPRDIIRHRKVVR